jgi:hypothetical protein
MNEYSFISNTRRFVLGHGGALVLALRHGDQPVRLDRMGEDSCSGSWRGKPEVQWGRLMLSIPGRCFTKQTGDMVYTMAENSWLSQLWLDA